MNEQMIVDTLNSLLNNPVGATIFMLIMFVGVPVHANWRSNRMIARVHRKVNYHERRALIQKLFDDKRYEESINEERKLDYDLLMNL